MTDGTDPAGEGSWPSSRFWDYSLDLYGRDGVETACLSLQERRGLDVNLVLFALWLGCEGVVLDQRALTLADKAIAGFRKEVVQSLRTARRHLRALGEDSYSMIVDAGPGQVDRLRRKITAAELDGEHLIQLVLDRLRAGLDDGAQAGILLAAANLQVLLPFRKEDRADLQTLLREAFPSSSSTAVDDALKGIGLI